MLVDAHAHLPMGCDLATALHYAARNFHAAAHRAGLTDETPGCVMLVEPAGAARFEAIRDGGESSVGGWYITRTDEACSLVLRYQAPPALVLVAGRQIVTAERLEVLALGTCARIADGQPMTETIQAVRAAGALPVLPWGVGKWWGRRGRIIEGLLREGAPGELFVGDNGGRPQHSPLPRLLRIARKRGIVMLPGSDPLPLKGQIRRIASYGCIVEVALDMTRPAASLKATLSRTRMQPHPYGRRASLPGFAFAQTAHRLHKHAGGTIT